MYIIRKNFIYSNVNKNCICTYLSMIKKRVEVGMIDVFNWLFVVEGKEEVEVRKL